MLRTRRTKGPNRQIVSLQNGHSEAVEICGTGLVSQKMGLCVHVLGFMRYPFGGLT